MFGADKFRSFLRRPLPEKKNSKAPDYTPLAQASKEAAQIMAGLGREQLDFARQQYNDAKPMFQQIVDAQISAQNETQKQARDYYDYQINTFRPVEQGLVRDAQNFNTEAYREQLASKAAADAGRAFTGTQAATQRAMASMGVNPNSGRFASMQNQNALGLAAAQANAMTGTRQQAEQMGYARKLDAAGLGRNLAGASNAAYGMAINAGNAAGHNQMAPGLAYTQMATPGINAIGSGQNMQLQGLSNIMNAQANVYAESQKGGLDMGGLMQGAAAMYGSGMFKSSDRRLKEDIVAVGVDERTGLTLYEFRYINGGDTRYRGVMADEVESYMPDAVSYDDLGYATVNYDMLGIEMVEV